MLKCGYGSSDARNPGKTKDAARDSPILNEPSARHGCLRGYKISAGLVVRYKRYAENPFLECSTSLLVDLPEAFMRWVVTRYSGDRFRRELLENALRGEPSSRMTKARLQDSVGSFAPSVGHKVIETGTLGFCSADRYVIRISRPKSAFPCHTFQQLEPLPHAAML
jgi:hypothetical protein